MIIEANKYTKKQTKGRKGKMELVKREIGNFNNLSFLLTHMDGHNGFIAGGCFKNAFQKEKIKDVDIFFRNREDLNKAIIYFESSDNYEKKYSNKNVEAFKCVKTSLVLELIKKKFGEPAEILSDFDFTITQFCILKEEEKEEKEGKLEINYTTKIIHNKNFFEHLFLKRLVIEKGHLEILFPENTFDRMIKYINYGYQPCMETKIKIISSIAESVDIKKMEISKSLYEGMD